jgi:hypothetical protein
MNYTVVFNISHSEENSYHKIYEILDLEFHLKHFEIQDERKVLTPQTTLIGKNDKYKSSKDFAEAIIDRLLNDDITLDRILVTKSNDYTLIG